MQGGLKVTAVFISNHYYSGIVERKAFQWDEVSLESKFHCLASYELKPGAAKDLVKMIWGFDNITDIRKLTRFFEKYLPG